MNRPRVRSIDSLDLDTLLTLAERQAIATADGHLTCLRFTSGWKCMFHTPNLDTGEGRDQVFALQTYPTLKEALIALISPDK